MLPDLEDALLMTNECQVGEQFQIIYFHDANVLFIQKEKSFSFELERSFYFLSYLKIKV